jgi:hypothetical protein
MSGACTRLCTKKKSTWVHSTIPSTRNRELVVFCLLNCQYYNLLYNVYRCNMLDTYSLHSTRHQCYCSRLQFLWRWIHDRTVIPSSERWLKWSNWLGLCLNQEQIDDQTDENMPSYKVIQLTDLMSFWIFTAFASHNKLCDRNILLSFSGYMVWIKSSKTSREFRGSLYPRVY